MNPQNSARVICDEKAKNYLIYQILSEVLKTGIILTLSFLAAENHAQ